LISQVNAIDLFLSILDERLSDWGLSLIVIDRKGA
jgi:hypothetical protein